MAQIIRTHSKEERNKAVQAWLELNAPADDSVSKLYEENVIYEGHPATFITESRRCLDEIVLIVTEE